MTRRWRWALMAVVVAILLPFVAAAWLVTSETGSHWLLRAAARLAGDHGIEVTFERVEGTLASDLQWHRLGIDAPGLELTVDRLGLAWRPLALLEGRLHITALSATGIRYHLEPGGEPAPPAAPPTLPDIALPLAIQVDELRVEDLHIAGEPSRRLELLTLTARLDPEGLTLRDIEIRGEGATVTGELGLATKAPHTLDGGLTATVPIPEAGLLAARLDIAGPALQPILTLRTTAPVEAGVEARLDLTEAEPRFALTLDAARLGWPLEGTAEMTVEDLKAHLEGSAGDYALDATATLGGPDLPTLRVDSFTARGDTAGLRDLDARLQALEGTLTVSGSAGWSPEPHWDLALAVAGLNPGSMVADWPGALSGTLKSAGIVAATGLQATVTVERLAGQLRDLPLALGGEFGYAGDRATIDTTIAGLDGEVRLAGELRPQADMRWDLTLEADGIDPRGLLPEWPGRLNARIGSTGSLPPAGPTATVAVQRLEGRLRDQPVMARGTLEYAAGRAATDGFVVASGDNRLTLTGEAGERLNLDYAIQAPDLAAVYPGLRGNIQGEGRVGGTPAAPTLQAELTARGVGFEAYAAERLDLAATWTGERADLRLEAAGLAGGGQRIDDLAAIINGTPENHLITVNATGPAGSLELAARGGLDGERWRGELTTLALDAPIPGPWTLAEAVALTLSPEAVDTGPLCLTREDARLCAGGAWRQGGEMDVAGTLAGLPLAWLAVALPPETRLAGDLHGDFGIAGPVAAPAATLSLRSDDGTLTVATGDDEPLVVPFGDVRVDARYGPDGGTAEAGLRLAEDGGLQARIRLGAGERPALKGRIDANLPDLALVSGFVPALAEVDGRLALDVAVGGTLEAPRFDGRLELADGRSDVVAVGLELRDMNIMLEGDGSGPFALAGSLRSGEGTLNLAGSVDPFAAPGPGIDLTITGERVQAADLPDIGVVVSPDLRIRGSGRYHLSGRLTVPRARIELKELPPSAVKVSDDAVVVEKQEDTGPTADSAPPRLTADVNVVLGNEVRFKGFGLTTGLTGNLDAKVGAEGSQLYGRIDLVDGAYKAYGQDLRVEQGRLLFNGPVENPTLDLRAVRTSNDGRVKAFLAINSPVSNPRPRIYTEPASSDAEALAYLVTGRGLDQAGQQEGLDMAAAALSMGLSRSAPVLQDIGQRLGLDELRVEGGANGIADSSVILGKYLNPNLYLSYSQGVLDTVGEVILKLRLTEHIEVESRSGTEQALDIYYQLER
ncbi:MAG: translocation/assembly module TamB domain-containing protein [Gammaproteobacteria bacterium]|nr:translocation/assembly module TamB domain-containing protein [Gammaproteobacteria bacterium]